MAKYILYGNAVIIPPHTVIDKIQQKQQADDYHNDPGNTQKGHMRIEPWKQTDHTKNEKNTHGNIFRPGFIQPLLSYFFPRQLQISFLPVFSKILFAKIHWMMGELFRKSSPT